MSEEHIAKIHHSMSYRRKSIPTGLKEMEKPNAIVWINGHAAATTNNAVHMYTAI